MNLAGIWLDKAHAVVVRIQDGEEELTRFESDTEHHHRSTHGAPAPSKYGTQYDADERKRHEQEQHTLNRYYRNVTDAVKEAETIFVMGPGEAKKHLAKILKKSNGAAERNVKVESADRMPDKQVVLKVREAFNIKPPRMVRR